jgi:hypothetical protein
MRALLCNSVEYLLYFPRGPAMDETRLPCDVVNRIERRLQSRFAQMLKDCEPPPESCDPLHSPRVRRLLEGSLRSPVPRE